MKICTATYLETCSKLFTSTRLGMVHWKPLDIITAIKLMILSTCQYSGQSRDNELESAEKTGNWNTLQYCLGRALDMLPWVCKRRASPSLVRMRLGYHATCTLLCIPISCVLYYTCLIKFHSWGMTQCYKYKVCAPRTPTKLVKLV